VVFLAAQWRGWATPWALDPDILAPNLERFGARELVYTRAYTACPAVGKGRESLLKGQFPPFPEDAESPVTATVSSVSAALEFLDKNRAISISAGGRRRVADKWAVAIQFRARASASECSFGFRAEGAAGTGALLRFACGAGFGVRKTTRRHRNTETRG
jgi:hypothetical protein